MRNEFALIDAIVEGLGDRATGDWVSVGPGDDAAVIKTTPGLAQVASIDTLLPDVHFPAAAPAHLIGYRALMVSFRILPQCAPHPATVWYRCRLMMHSLRWAQLGWSRLLVAWPTPRGISGSTFAGAT